MSISRVKPGEFYIIGTPKEMGSLTKRKDILVSRARFTVLGARLKFKFGDGYKVGTLIEWVSRNGAYEYSIEDSMGVLYSFQEMPSEGIYADITEIENSVDFILDDLL